MRASTPAAAKKRLVSSGYSVDTLTPSGRSAADSYGEFAATASTTRTGLFVAFE